MGQALLDDGRSGLLVRFASEEVEVQHPFADSVGVGTGMHRGGSFNGDSRAVDDGLRESVALPGPIVDVNTRKSPPFAKKAKGGAPSSSKLGFVIIG